MSVSSSKKSNTVRLPAQLQKQIEKIAAKNDLAVADVIRLCLLQAIPVIEKQGLTIKPT